MISSNSFEIRKFDFNAAISEKIDGLNFANNLWPIVYLLSQGKEKIAYVGETADAVKRMNTHLKNTKKRKLTEAHLIESKMFNKSATLDIESNLIKYISGDGQYQLLNDTIGLANHNYYQKEEVYWGMFTSIWDSLRSLGIADQSIEEINNSDLFKYSPYKTLSIEQLKGLSLIIDSLIDNSYKNIVMKGGAGTGKTILAVFLFKLLVTDLSDFNSKDLGSDNGVNLLKKVERLKQIYPKPKMALVVPMSSFRNTLKKVFSNVKGLKASMVVGPTDITRDKYDIVVVDEAHRLKRRKNLTNYKSFDDGNKRLNLDTDHGTELDWIKLQSNQAIFFYDKDQSIKPSDIEASDFYDLIHETNTYEGNLTSQFRVRGGNGYVKFVNNLMDVNIKEHKPFSDSNYDLKIFSSISSMIQSIKNKDQEFGLSRMIAGFSWEWISKKTPELFDIEIEGLQLRWNTEPSEWINSEGSVEEVGCIHTTQGYDLNYAGVIFGKEIGFDSVRQEIIIHKENYHDKKGGNGIKDPAELKHFILNIYKTILLRGIRGTYIYVCDPDLRKYIASYLNRALSEFKKEVEPVELIPYQNSVPLYDLKAAAGLFSESQKVEDHEWVQIPSNVKASEDLFACEVIGESMNRIIPNGSICLFKKYNGGSRNGKIVLAQSSEIQDTDMGSGYTVKEYYSKKAVNDSGWGHESIRLRPISNDATFDDIVLDAQGMESFRVIGIFDRVLS